MAEIPVTVVTGFLGSGKTTLLNNLLTREHGKRYAVVVNEVGALGIDNDLIVDADEEVFEMNNGCLCCTVRGDLIRILTGLLKRRKHLDGIIVETTGLADPTPVAQTFFFDDDIQERTRLDGVVAVADAGHLETQLAERHEAADQLAFADRIVLNKIDQVDDATRQRLATRLAGLNPFAQIIPASYGEVDPGEIVGLNAFDLERVQQQHPHFLDDHHHHHHDDDVAAISLSCQAPLDGERFMAWLESLVAERGQDMLRYKGILAFQGSLRRFVMQGVHMQMQGDFAAPWGQDEDRTSRLVVIGRNLDGDQLQSAFERLASQRASA